MNLPTVQIHNIEHLYKLPIVGGQFISVKSQHNTGAG